MGIETTGVRQQPEFGAPEHLRLPAENCCRPGEGDPISADAEHRDACRGVPLHLRQKSAPSGHEFRRAKLVRARSSVRDQIGHPAAMLEELALLPRGEE